MRCPVCGEADADLFLEQSDDALDASAIGPSRRDVRPGRIMRCRVCGLAFRLLRPSDEALAHIYRDLDEGLYEAEAAGRARTAERHLRIVQRYIRQGRLLDVGCASGSFLHAACEAGWDVTGVEPSAELSRIAGERLDADAIVINSTLQDSGLPASSFDVVTMWDVLEHVRDPVDFLSQVAKLLRRGGYLFVNVPDVDSLQARVLGTRWPLLLPEHLNYFDRRSLLWCGRKANLVWRDFGRRWAFFSIEYVFYRLAQHDIPGAKQGYRLSRGRALGRSLLSVPLGELWAAWQAPLSNGKPSVLTGRSHSHHGSG